MLASSSILRRCLVSRNRRFLLLGTAALVLAATAVLVAAGESGWSGAVVLIVIGAVSLLSLRLSIAAGVTALNTERRLVRAAATGRVASDLRSDVPAAYDVALAVDALTERIDRLEREFTVPSVDLSRLEARNVVHQARLQTLADRLDRLETGLGHHGGARP